MKETGTSIEHICLHQQFSKKYLEQSNQIKQNWAAPENIVINFCIIFQCCYQSYILTKIIDETLTKCNEFVEVSYLFINFFIILETAEEI